jgi:hypothetical protein
MKKLFIFIAMLLLYIPIVALATMTVSVPLHWDNYKYQHDGFRVYMQYEDEEWQPVWTGTKNECSVEVGRSGNYKFAVRAFRGDRESDSSNVYSESVSLPPDPQTTYSIHIGEGGHITITPGITGSGIDAEINPGSSEDE